MKRIKNKKLAEEQQHFSSSKREHQKQNEIYCGADSLLIKSPVFLI